MRHLVLGTCALLALTTSTALATGAQDAAYDKHATPVIDTRGHCVRTKWMDANDPCVVAPPPAPVAEVVPTPPPVAVPVVSLEQRTIYFDFDSATLTPESTAKLDSLGSIINASSAIADVRIHGFTDQLGSNSYNEALATKRANSVKSYLDGKSRLNSTVAEVKGLGKSSPAEECTSIKKRTDKIACMGKERRVEIELKAQQ